MNVDVGALVAVYCTKVKKRYCRFHFQAGYVPAHRGGIDSEGRKLDMWIRIFWGPIEWRMYVHRENFEAIANCLSDVLDEYDERKRHERWLRN